MHLELNGRSYLFLAALLAMGLFFEALKFWPGSSHPIASTEDILQLSKPFAVSETTIRETAKMMNANHALPKRAIFAGLPTLDMKGQIEKWQKEQEKLQAEEKKKKDAAKNWHWVWNKEAQKWEWKKKVKKKKADPASQASTTVLDQPSANPTDATQTQASNPNVTTGMPGPASTNAQSTAGLGGAVGSAATTPQKFLSEQEWLDYLESSPSQSKMDTFIKQHSQHLVSDQTYYQVLGSMLKSSNITVQQDAVYALAKTPSSESFDLLAGEETSLQTSSPLYQATNQDLSQYSSLQNVSILQQVLGQSGQSQGVLTVALNQLQTSVNSNVGTATAQPSAQSPNAKQYQGFVPELTQIANSNSSLSSTAHGILNQLAQFGIH